MSTISLSIETGRDCDESIYPPIERQKGKKAAEDWWQRRQQTKQKNQSCSVREVKTEAERFVEPQV